MLAVPPVQVHERPVLNYHFCVHLRVCGLIAEQL